LPSLRHAPIRNRIAVISDEKYHGMFRVDENPVSSRP
jgi:hypothetical protein